MTRPHHIRLGGQGGVMLCVELPDGRRVLQCGGVDVIRPEQAETLVKELRRVQPWLDGTGVTDNRDEFEKMARGVVIGPRREA